MHVTKPQIEWDLLDIPESAQYYQPKGAITFEGDRINEARFFRKNFTEVLVPRLDPNWLNAGHSTNWAGSIKIPEEYINGTGDLVVVDDLIELENPFKNQLKHSHYFRDVSKLDKVDFYMLCRLFDVTDPCLQHIFKKVIATGNRGHKNYQQDIQDIFDTAKRLLEIEEELK